MLPVAPTSPENLRLSDEAQPLPVLGFFAPIAAAVAGAVRGGAGKVLSKVKRGKPKKKGPSEEEIQAAERRAELARFRAAEREAKKTSPLGRKGTPGERAQADAIVKAAGVLGAAGLGGPALLEALRPGEEFDEPRAGPEGEDEAEGGGEDHEEDVEGGGVGDGGHADREDGGGKKASPRRRPSEVPGVPPPPSIVRVERAGVRAQRMHERKRAQAQARLERALAREATRRAAIAEGGAVLRQGVATVGDVLATAASHKPAGVLLAATPAAWLAMRALGVDKAQAGAGVTAALGGLSSAMLPTEGEQPAQRATAPVVAPAAVPAAVAPVVVPRGPTGVPLPTHDAATFTPAPVVPQRAGPAPPPPTESSVGWVPVKGMGAWHRSGTTEPWAWFGTDSIPEPARSNLVWGGLL